MTRYRHVLPQLDGDFFLTDGGIETTLIFLEGLELPDFAAFTLLHTAEGEATLGKYFDTYAALAKRFGTGLILESATWRASPDWASKLGYDRDALTEANRKAIRLLENVRDKFDTPSTPVVISGCLGPRGDGYVPDRAMSADEAEMYHGGQMEIFADSAADMASAITMNYVEEALGIARAARRTGMPVAISFTVETDGKLPTGQTLRSAIDQVDDATSAYPCYYMINCAHPTHFAHVVASDAPWVKRIRGVRANASRMSHTELNESTVLDSGNPVELARQYAELKGQLSELNVMGGCCGTDHRHMEQIAAVCLPLFRAAG